MYRRLVIALLSLLVWSACTAMVSAAGRVALVIGNGIYEAANPLKNPTTDATAVSSALSAAGFEVIYKENLTYSDMVRELGSFQRIAAKSESAVIYYAGHGMEIDKQNFLIPVDAQLEFVSDADFQTVPLQLLQRAVADAEVLGLVIVDACRNNPFATRLSQAEDSGGVGFGLARVEPRGNTLVALAAREGTFAFDGKGDNSPYAVALVKAIQTPGLEISKLFRQVRDEVLALTNGAQEPVLFGSLSSEDYYFLPPLSDQAESVPVSEEPAETVSDAAIDLQVELAFWESALSSGLAEDLAAYLEIYPDGKFARLARNRLVQLSTEVAAAQPAPVDPSPDAEAAPSEPVSSGQDKPQVIAENVPVAPPAEPVALAEPQQVPAPAPQEMALAPQTSEPAAPTSPQVDPASPPPISSDTVALSLPEVEPSTSLAQVETEPAKTPEPEPVSEPEPQVLAEPAEPAGAPDAPPLPVFADLAQALPTPLAPAQSEPIVRGIHFGAPPELAAFAIVLEPLPEPELSGNALHAALQAALTAAGCNPGPIDGDWGAGSTRALGAFAKARPDLVAADAEPSEALLRAMAQAPGPVCPTTCPDGQNLVGGACVAPVSCPAGQKLSSKGVCFVPETVVRKPAAKPRASGCRIFNGKQIC